MRTSTIEPVARISAFEIRGLAPGAAPNSRCRNRKRGVYVRLDADVLDWLKSKGKGYQPRMNAMLRALMESDRRPH